MRHCGNTYSLSHGFAVVVCELAVTLLWKECLVFDLSNSVSLCVSHFVSLDGHFWPSLLHFASCCVSDGICGCLSLHSLMPCVSSRVTLSLSLNTVSLLVLCLTLFLYLTVSFFLSLCLTMCVSV